MRHCICGASLEITGERLDVVSAKIKQWEREHWRFVDILGTVEAEPGHGRCDAVTAWQARTGQAESYREMTTGGIHG
jgi:hypothetical protein